MRIQSAMCTLIFLLATAPIVAGLFFVYRKYTNLEEHIQALVASKEMVPEPIKRVVPEVASAAQVWRPVQERVKDTVVQILAHVSQIDLLQPFKSPTQGAAAGSGFLISDDGKIVTNAHVVDQATRGIWVQIPSFGQDIFDAYVVGVSYDRDLALLQLDEKAKVRIQERLGSIPYLTLGDSDTLYRSEDVLALGYPLGQRSLKSTTGVISGYEQNMIQISAPINPGSSGGPLLDSHGLVVGVNSSGVIEAQNVGYAIPINEFKIIWPDLEKVKLLHKPYLGFFFNNSTPALTEFLGNPKPGGCYVAEVIKGGTLEKAGVISGDMIYEINGHMVDSYGEMNVSWSEDKVSLSDYVGRLRVGQTVNLVVYRRGSKKDFSVMFDHTARPAIRQIYPGYEDIDYELFGGIAVMELTMNHIGLLASAAPGLARYAEANNQTKSVLVVTHVFPNSQVYRARIFSRGATINEVNGVKVSTLAEYREAIKHGVNNRFFTLRVSNNMIRASDNLLVALDWNEIIEEEPKLARDYKYQLSETAQDIIRLRTARIQPSMPAAESKL